MLNQKLYAMKTKTILGIGILFIFLFNYSVAGPEEVNLNCVNASCSVTQQFQITVNVSQNPVPFNCTGCNLYIIAKNANTGAQVGATAYNNGPGQYQFNITVSYPYPDVYVTIQAIGHCDCTYVVEPSDTQSQPYSSTFDVLIGG